MATQSKDVPDAPLILRYRGKYDFDGLITLIRQFYARSRFDFLKEPKYKSKGGEVEFKFESQREVTQYIAVYLKVEGHMWDVKRDEKGVTSGKLEIVISSKYILDYANQFTKGKSIDEWMQQTLDATNTGLQFMDIKVTGKKYLEKLTSKLQSEIKKHLKMECV